MYLFNYIYHHIIGLQGFLEQERWYRKIRKSKILERKIICSNTIIKQMVKNMKTSFRKYSLQEILIHLKSEFGLPYQNFLFSFQLAQIIFCQKGKSLNINSNLKIHSKWLLLLIYCCYYKQYILLTTTSEGKCCHFSWKLLPVIFHPPKICVGKINKSVPNHHFLPFHGAINVHQEILTQTAHIEWAIFQLNQWLTKTARREKSQKDKHFFLFYYLFYKDVLFLSF